MRTLNAADEPDPPRGFVADWSVTWPTTLPTQPWLREVRDDTIPLTWPPGTTAAANTAAMLTVDIAPKGGWS